MKTKPLFLTVCLLAIVALLAYWISGSDKTELNPAASRNPGDRLLDPELFQEITEIRLAGDSDENWTVLRKEGDSWILPDHFGLPVDFDKLTRLTNDLIDAKIERFVTAKSTSLERLNLGQASAGLFSGESETWSFEIGDNGQNGGRFVRINNEEAAYLTRGYLSIDSDQENWPVKRPLQLEEREIARVEIEIDGETLAFSRTEASADFAGENLAENERAKAREISTLLRTLLNGRFTEALDPENPDAQAARENALPVTLEEFDGTRYTLKIGRRPGSGPSEKAAKSTTSASIVVDQDGNIVSPEEIAAAEQEAQEQDSETEVEVVEPGPVFIFYQSESPEFIWSHLMEKVALKFGDHIFNRLPKSRTDLIDVADPEPAEVADSSEMIKSETMDVEAEESEAPETEVSGQ